MFGFSKQKQTTSIAVDIGSSSVGIAIVNIDSDNKNKIIWNHREFSLIHSDPSEKQQLKQIKTTLVNAFLELSHSGMKALKESHINSEIEEIQAIFSAPWSYTITKTITLKDDHPFEIKKEMINELVESAQKQGKLNAATNKLASTLGLDISGGSVIDVSINDYSLARPINQSGRKVSLTYLQTATSQGVSKVLNETIEKFFPKAAQTSYSFMYAYYLTLKHLHPNTSEVCLIDVTGESTEIGIVRENVLKHTSHVPAGMYTISRSLAESTGATKEEAYSYMKDSPSDIVNRLPKKAADKAEKSLEEYREKITELFLRTGDILSIPNTIFLHTDAKTEAFFVEQLSQAALLATGKRHTIHPITARVINESEEADSAILLGVEFLAKKDQYFEILPKES